MNTCPRCQGKVWGRNGYCPSCGLEVVDYGSTAVEHPSDNRRTTGQYACELCDMRTSNAGAFAGHMRTHGEIGTQVEMFREALA